MIEEPQMSNKPKKSAFIAFIFSWILCTGFAEPIHKILKDYNSKSGRKISVVAINATSGKSLYSYRSDKPLIPASNMKIITSAAALHYLGPQYVFRTSVGVLDKNLVIVGGGDPLLADPKHDNQPAQAANALMDTIVAQVKKAGITELDNIIVDTSFFDDQYVHLSWPADELNRWYACEVSGLNFYTNCVFLNVKRQGNRAVFEMLPENSYVHLVNQLRYISSGSSRIGAYRNSVPNKLIVKGTLNRQAGFDVAIENPAGLFASVLKDRFEDAGLTIKGQLLQKYVKNEEKIRYLVIFETPISKVLKRCNTDSLGLAAESLVKTISAENSQGKINGQWSHGLKLISQYLDSLSVPSGHYVLDDGSGLSRNNRLTAQCLVAVLKDVYDSPYSEMFIASLAVGGQKGTIGRYFKTVPYKGNILGKTGYIAGVHSFSGICRTPRGDILFSILSEKGNRQTLNDITKAIYDGTY